MKKLISGILICFLSSPLFAQISLDKFMSIELGSSISTVKQIFLGEKWEERNLGTENLYFFSSYLGPSAVTASFLITKANKLSMKSISNGVIKKDSALELFNNLKETLIKKFGEKFERKNTREKIFLVWKIGKYGTITLSNDNEKTILVCLESIGIPFNKDNNGR